jgi:RND family efflux transporter MFP subunit
MTRSSSQSKSSVFLTCLILAGGVCLSYFLFKTGPQVTTEEETPVAKIVKVREVRPDRYPVFVSAYGSIVPAKRVTIEPEVTGLVIRHHPKLTPGGRVAKGEELFAIDPTLAEISLQESKSAVARATVNLQEAQRKLAEAKRLANDSLIPDTELAMLESETLLQDAELARLKAGLQRSEEMLKRHSLYAPFNAIVLDEDVDMGQRIDPGFSAATLIGADELWIQVSLPVDQIKHIRLPSDENEGSRASIYHESGGKKQFLKNGKVIGLRGDLEREGRMARLIVSFQNEAMDAPSPTQIPMLIGSYVRVDIEAGELEDCLAIEQSSLRSGDKLWVVDTNDQLQIRDVEVFWQMDDMVYVSNGLKPGDKLITSPLKSAVPGTELNPQSEN